MAMTEKQIRKRLEDCFMSEYGRYDEEAEWWGDDDPHIWRCDIPSLRVGVRLTLIEEDKRIDIEERRVEGNGWYGEYHRVGNYSWKR